MFRHLEWAAEKCTSNRAAKNAPSGQIKEPGRQRDSVCGVRVRA